MITVYLCSRKWGENEEVTHLTPALDVHRFRMAGRWSGHQFEFIHHRATEEGNEINFFFSGRAEAPWSRDFLCLVASFAVNTLKWAEAAVVSKLQQQENIVYVLFSTLVLPFISIIELAGRSQFSN